ncbi:BRI3-binding protein-like [Sinocyclocheilus rhinocerous]|uniref:BRI3-binding protein-like n=1 Tax=Sinocyclocheilus rhinocerous TaxID=307959 RepID=UPI0007B83457|nr:PREDICTED: BRI3-binding protein-like [Sinocyclocheilus rhinocerous]
MKGAKLAVVLSVFLAFVLLTETARSKRDSSSQNSFRRAASGFYQTFSNIFGEENIRALYKFFSKTTERFVYGVDSLLDTLWKLWVDLLDVMGIDSSNLTHYFSPSSVSSSPARALLLPVTRGYSEFRTGRTIRDRDVCGNRFQKAASHQKCEDM